MKKILVVSVLLLALLLLLMPLVVGMNAENQFRRLAGNIEGAAPGYRWVVDDYERGWFSSRARYRLELGPQLVGKIFAHDSGAHRLPTIASESRILHGPIFFAGIGRRDVSMLPALAHSIDTITVIGADGEGIAIPGSVRTRLGLFGRHENVVALDAVETSFDGGGQPAEIRWEGMNLTTLFNSALDEVAYSGEIGAASIAMPAFTLTTGGVQIGGEQGLTEFGFWSGEQRGDFAGFTMSGGGGRSFSISEMSWSAAISVSDGAVDQSIDLFVESVALEQWRGGPISFLIAIDGLDAAAIGELIENPGGIFAGEDPESAEAIVSGFGFFEKLLGRGAEIDLEKLSVSTPEGELSLRARISVPETAQGTLAMMLANLEGNASLRIPAGLADLLKQNNPEADAQLQGLIAAGLLINKDDALIMDVALKGMLLTINGQPMALPLLF